MDEDGYVEERDEYNPDIEIERMIANENVQGFVPR